MSHSSAENFTFERAEENTIKVLVKLGEKTLFEKKLHTFLFVLGVPLLIVLAVFLLLTSIFSVLFASYEVTEQEPGSYEDAKKWFSEGNGYLDSLESEEKSKLLSKKENLPLGL